MFIHSFIHSFIRSFIHSFQIFKFLKSIFYKNILTKLSDSKNCENWLRQFFGLDGFGSCMFLRKQTLNDFVNFYWFIQKLNIAKKQWQLYNMLLVIVLSVKSISYKNTFYSILKMYNYMPNFCKHWIFLELCNQHLQFYRHRISHQKSL